MSVPDDENALSDTAQIPTAEHIGKQPGVLTADFLKVIWPSQGFYCIAQPKRNGDRSWWQHDSFSSIDAAVEKALNVGQTSDIYFTVLSLREAFIIDQAKIDKAVADGRKITSYTGRTYRSHANITWARTFFIDLDVGKADGYATQEVAFEALKAFVKTTGLPRPWIVISGVGLHIYWPLDVDVPADEWRGYAIKLKRICEHQGLKADPVRTADVASVLRIPGTYHFKDPDNPKRVRVEREGPISSWDTITNALDRAFQLTPTGTTHQCDIPASMQTAPVELDRLKRACGVASNLIDNPAEANEPKWYKLLGLVRFVENGRQVCHDISELHPHYESEWIDKKLDQLERRMPDGTQLGPTTCKSMAETCGSEHCAQCWFAGTSLYKEGSSSPIVAARRLPLDATNGLSRKLLTAAEVKNLPTQPYRVRGLLPVRGLASIYGEPGCGKTFLALDLAMALANGHENWFGRRMRPCPVIYVALEGRGGFQKRLKAWELDTGETASDDIRFMLDDLSLVEAAGVERLAAEIVAEVGPDSVVFVDTLNQSAPGADENNSADMSKIISNAKLLMDRIEGLVVLVHHAGKDRSRGLRGHSSLLAALDTVIEVVSISGARTWTATKIKDDEPGSLGDFELICHQVGVDEDGMPITSCAVRHTIHVRSVGSKPIRGKRQEAAMETLRPLLAGGGAIPRAKAVEAVAAALKAPEGRRVTYAKDVVENLLSGGALRSTNNGEITLTKN